ncbi:MAG: phage terminase large subunit [Alphaproteobacteria bacterium]
MDKTPLSTPIDFKLFTALWNQTQGRKTPIIHLKMAHWLEHCWTEGKHHMLLMAFRSAGKSTIVGLFAAWLIYCNPNTRILVLAADLGLAKKMVRNVKRIIERHPLTEALKPSNADQWASDRFTVLRDLELRDPSIMAKGVISNITGSRADIVICDDVEVPNTCDTATKREDLRERLGEIPYVLIAGGAQLYVGTPHHYYSIYADTPRSEIGEEDPFLNNFARLALPVLDEEGRATWPERYTPEDISSMRRAAGPNKFDSQMMLKPVNIMQGRLNPDVLQIYDVALEYDKTLKTLFIGHMKMAGASCWWDPSFGKAGGDNSVCATVFTDEGGNFYLHHLVYIKIDETDPADEATQQARIVTGLAKDMYLPSITVEINGIGRFLPNILRNELSAAHVPARVMEASSTRNKAVRIIEAFDALMAAQRLFIHKSITQTPFLMEMREWRPQGSSGKDDALDAVAGALSCQPDRLVRAHAKGGYSWMRGNNTHKATKDWNI